MLIYLQCLDCLYFPSLKTTYRDRFEGRFYCNEYKDGIPADVEDGSGVCPKFVGEKTTHAGDEA
jgi:hypothetical protein